MFNSGKLAVPLHGFRRLSTSSSMDRRSSLNILYESVVFEVGMYWREISVVSKLLVIASHLKFGSRAAVARLPRIWKLW